MKNPLAFILIFLGAFICVAQQTKTADTTYLRYDRSPGHKTLSNYMVIKTKLASGKYEFKEYYRFTEPMVLKANYMAYGNGKKDGPYKGYTKDSFIKEEGTYKEDQKVGEWIYYKEGQLQCKVSYIAGKKEGVSTYFVNGKELYIWNYKNGKSHGPNKSYYDNGKLKFEGTYSNGKLHGKSVDYSKEGDVRVISNYQNGKLHGAFTRYRENKKIMGEGAYVDGKEIGEWKWYREDGTMASHELYGENGRLKKVTFYDQKGKELRSRKKDVFTGVIEEKKKLQKAIQTHVRGKFNYPETMRQRGIEGKVYVKFKIDKEGKVCDIEYRSDTHDALEVQAKNLIASLPRQKPATVHNMPMGVLFTIPMVYRIQN